MFFKNQQKHIDLEESLGAGLPNEADIIEVPLSNAPLLYLGAAIFVAGIVFILRILQVDFYSGTILKSRADANVTRFQFTSAPRGLIFDRYGSALAENKGVFRAILDAKEFLGNGDLQEKTLAGIENTLYLPRDYVWDLIRESSLGDFIAPIVLSDELTQEQLVALKGLDLPTIVVESGFQRIYPKGQIFSSVVGYTGRANPDDLKTDANLPPESFLGRSGVEAFYNKELGGKPGVILTIRDARGRVLSEEEKSKPETGSSLKLTIDGGFQEYFYYRLKSGLESLGRRVGIGMAMNPQNGEILALVNFPAFDNNLLVSSGRNSEKQALLNSKDKPLFNRAVGGFYTPGSTIKPLVGVAALREGIINPKRQIFSPGYIDVPNPYDPDKPTRFLDWRYQGNVDLASAIAQSSNVYFYTVGGGAQTQIFSNGQPQDTGYLKGLGINLLKEWWQKFNLGQPTGIDLAGEGEGFLPSPQWKQEKTGRPWLLGDTYNVSIGQGDLLLTPIQLLDYISAIANGGKIYEPVVNFDKPHPKAIADLAEFNREIGEVQKGMKQTVASPQGTAYKLNDLGFSVAAKTGSSQVENNAQENAIFVGYAPASAEAAGRPAEKPQIAVLVLVEHSLEGSLNAVPIAKDVLNWYYWNRINK